MSLKLKGDDPHLDQPLDEDPMRRDEIERHLDDVLMERGFNGGTGARQPDYKADFEGAALNVSFKKPVPDADMREIAEDLFSRLPGLLSSKSEVTEV